MYQYSKPALTIDQQIDLLVGRGMFIPDRLTLILSKFVMICRLTL